MCTCQSCGIQYKVDLLVKDALWKKIQPSSAAPGSGLLCGMCIMQRIEQASGYGAYRLVELN